MSSKSIDTIVQDAGESIGAVAVAVLLLTHALKKQPGFDIDAFDALIEKALLNSNVKKMPIAEDILRGALSKED